MLFFDATVRKYYYRERYKGEVESDIASMNRLERQNLRTLIEANQKVVADPSASAVDKKAAAAEIKKLKKLYADISSSP